MVAGQTLHVIDGTEIKGEIQIGTPVKVHALVAPDGTLVVREIKPADEEDKGEDDNTNENENVNENANENEADESENNANASVNVTREIEIIAPVEAIGNGTITVAGQTLVITDQTEVKGQIEVGTLVKVHVLVTADGTLIVREIESADEDDEDHEANENANANANETEDDENGNADHANVNDDDRDDDHEDDDRSGSGGGDHDDGDRGGGREKGDD